MSHDENDKKRSDTGKQQTGIDSSHENHQMHRKQKESQGHDSHGGSHQGHDHGDHHKHMAEDLSNGFLYQLYII